MTATRDPRTDAGAGLGERLAALLASTTNTTTDSPVLVAATLPAPAADPISLYAAAVEVGLEAALWLRPSEGTAFVGIGRAWATEPSGDGRFHDAEAAWRALLSDARLDRPTDGVRGTGPVLLGAMGFTGREPAADDAWAPFGASSLVLSSLTLAIAPTGATVTASVVGGDEDPRDLERLWRSLLERAAGARPEPQRDRGDARVRAPRRRGRAAGSQGRLQAARRHVRRRGRPRPDRQGGARATGRHALARRARRRRTPSAASSVSAPESTTYAFRRDGRTFLGATPERLVRTEGRILPDGRHRGHDPRAAPTPRRTPSSAAGSSPARRTARSTRSWSDAIRGRSRRSSRLAERRARARRSCRSATSSIS